MDFRSTPEWHASLLVFPVLGGKCISQDDVDNQFGRGITYPACLDSICYYRLYKRPWGKIAAGLGSDQRAKCINSISLDSYPPP